MVSSAQSSSLEKPNSRYRRMSQHSSQVQYQQFSSSEGQRTHLKSVTYTHFRKLAGKPSLSGEPFDQQRCGSQAQPVSLLPHSSSITAKEDYFILIHSLLLFTNNPIRARWTEDDANQVSCLMLLG